MTGHLPELAIILVIALIVFGPQRLPEVTSSLGKAVREFRRATSELQEQVLNPQDSDEHDDFLHVPPPPPTVDDGKPIATIDTLAERQVARKRKQAAAVTQLSDGESAAEAVDSDAQTPAE
jgi:sec-independent protein translocase protein TatA